MPKAKVRIPFLLRKSRTGRDLPVLKEDDFPMPFMTEGKVYEIRRTKSGGLIMVKADG